MQASRASKFILIASLTWMSWLGMMLVHEGGHVLAALATGGHVQRIVWHPFAFSRTDVSPNPSKRIEIWGGPVLGCLLPLIAWMVGGIARSRHASYLAFFAGFCLIVNGPYLGASAATPVGDGRDLLHLGTPRWPLALFGIVTTLAGLVLIDRCRSDLTANASARSAIRWLIAATIVTGIGLVLGRHG